MRLSISLSSLRPLLSALAVVLLAGCTIAPPRTDDPLEKYNRKAYAFNDKLDKAVIRPVAVGYRKVTTPTMRTGVDNFFTNIRLPITVANDLLQARPVQAVQTSGRFLVNLTLGVGGLFDLASALHIPMQTTDFGVTLAHWGVPEGDYLVVPFVGPSTVRDVWALPVDSYFFDPLSYYPRNHHFKQGRYYIPQVLYLVSLRSRLLDAEGFLASAYDPYAFVRDAYRQQRINAIYYGNPPSSVIERMQGLDQKGFDPEQLLNEQQQWEKSNKPPATSETQQPSKQ